ncbi:OmpA family protein [Hymenobacter caeli]|uniref:Outer membrane protein OmpA-like peptidoglycan-associated protein n=1 Tax=Hymenobacter caeli TaxID=2735894 RepID=A0ABX2FT36_9BACT|nr:OmpA family protein [Hymenobacter caeli]NRT20348.1 outer membrane protein OmpA-like peptidoglycan-associated protein [Hymenobacter caeli]
MQYFRSSFTFFLALLLLVGHFGQAQTSTVTTDKPKGMSKTVKGGILGGLGGAAGGALLGRVIGGKSGTAKGAILGAVVGGGAGALIGRKMDKQAAELRRDLEGATVERVGEGIKITFASGILFGSNSATLTPAAAGNIDELATTLQKYADTNVVVEGHTDSSGSDAINQPLSQRRAQAVANELTAKSVDAARITATGYGSTQPVADNTTVAGKAANRRVEVAIFANEKMQKAAKKGTL